MGSFDSVTWQALTLVLTGVGVVGTVVLWRARGAVAGLRALAATLLVPAAYLTGTLRLLWEIGDAVVSWAVRLAFSPTVWLGMALAVTAAAVFATASLVDRRTAGPAAGKRTRAGRRLRRRTGADAGDGKPAPPRAVTSTRGQAAPVDDDMTDIEAILRRHGIS